MELEFDEEKRNSTLIERNLDFRRANEVFQGTVFTFVDDRLDYGELRFTTMGLLDRRVVSVSWTIRGEKRRIISMRKANEREQTRYYRSLE